jgi:hypothetical protein
MEMSKEPRVVITLRLSKLERDKLIDKANKMGISLNEYLRFRLGFPLNEKSTKIISAPNPYLINELSRSIATELARQEASPNKAGLCPPVSFG